MADLKNLIALAQRLEAEDTNDTDCLEAAKALRARAALTAALNLNPEGRSDG
jgi:hypothetical protein